MKSYKMYNSCSFQTIHFVYTISKNFARTSGYGNSFIPITTWLWNRLPLCLLPGSYTTLPNLKTTSSNGIDILYGLKHIGMQIHSTKPIIGIFAEYTIHKSKPSSTSTLHENSKSHIYDFPHRMSNENLTTTKIYHVCQRFHYTSFSLGNLHSDLSMTDFGTCGQALCYVLQCKITLTYFGSIFSYRFSIQCY